MNDLTFLFKVFYTGPWNNFLLHLLALFHSGILKLFCISAAFEVSGCLIHFLSRSLHCLSRRWYFTSPDFQVIKSHACQEHRPLGCHLQEATSSFSETEAKRDHSRAESLEAPAGSAEVFLAPGFVWLSSMYIQCWLLFFCVPLTKLWQK